VSVVVHHECIGRRPEYSETTEESQTGETETNAVEETNLSLLSLVGKISRINLELTRRRRALVFKRHYELRTYRDISRLEGCLFYFEKERNLSKSVRREVRVRQRDKELKRSELRIVEQRGKPALAVHGGSRQLSRRATHIDSRRNKQKATVAGYHVCTWTT
jgi:hypothetical protein